MLSTIAACGTIKKEIGLRRDSEAFLICHVSLIPSLPSVPSNDGSFFMHILSFGYLNTLEHIDYVSVVYLFYAFLSFFIKFAIAILTGQGNRIKIPPSFCIRQCGEDIFTTMLTAVGNKWGIVCKKVVQSLSKSCIYH